jgi:hypothetical protein
MAPLACCRNRRGRLAAGLHQSCVIAVACACGAPRVAGPHARPPRSAPHAVSWSQVQRVNRKKARASAALIKYPRGQMPDAQPKGVLLRQRARRQRTSQSAKAPKRQRAKEPKSQRAKEPKSQRDVSNQVSHARPTWAIGPHAGSRRPLAHLSSRLRTADAATPWGSVSTLATGEEEAK